MIAIGAVYNGPEHQQSFAKQAITVAMNGFCDLRGTDEIGGEIPGLNVVFYVPGSLGDPDWVGLRDSKFSRKKKMLMVQVAVPRVMVNSPSLPNFIIESIHGANKIAFQFFHAKGIEFPLADAEDLTDRVQAHLSWK